MKVAYFGYGDDISRLRAFLEANHDVSSFDVDEDLSCVADPADFDLIVSFGYRKIFSEDFILRCKKPPINIHLSYLPFNKGAHPIFWAFYDNTPLGVSIHFIDSGIDTGELLLRHQLVKNSAVTFRMLWHDLIAIATELFIDNFDMLVKVTPGNYSLRNGGESGSYHRTSELPMGFRGWDMVINEEILRLKFAHE